MRVAVVGGSLGGLTAALSLKDLAKKMPTLISRVDVYEKSPTRLTDGGAGIVLQPEVAEALDRYTPQGHRGVQVYLKRRQFAEKDGSIRSMHMPQPMTSWEAVWKRLREALPDDSHHPGVTITGIEELSNGKLKLLGVFANRAKEDVEYDLVIAADGAGSVIRNQFLHSKPTYAGYVAYRGTLPVKDAPPEVLSFFNEAFSMYSYPNSRQHILVYLIPGIGGSTDPADLRINWVWYRNKDLKVMTDKNGRERTFSVPAGLLPQDVEKEAVEAAQRLLAPQFASLVSATSNPYIQAIHDMSADRLILGEKERVVLIGDAAGLVRPHTASGTSKAAADAMELADLLESTVLRSDSNTVSASQLTSVLKTWEQERLFHLRGLEDRGRMMGDKYGREVPE